MQSGRDASLRTVQSDEEDDESEGAKHARAAVLAFWRTVGGRAAEWEPFWKFFSNYRRAALRQKAAAAAAAQSGDGAASPAREPKRRRQGEGASEWAEDRCGEVPRGAAAPTSTLPATYDPRYRINLAVAVDLERVTRVHSDKEWAHADAAEETLQQAKMALYMYEDFRQKQRFKQVAKVQRDRRALPIAPFEAEIVNAVRDHRVIVLAGDTGCGKSTQVPQYLLRAGCDRMVCTQPRRISAISLARRVAVENNNQFGSTIGHQIRFDSSRTAHTYVPRVFPLCALVPRVQGSSGAVATVQFVWRGHAKTPTTRAGPWPDFALRLE